MSYTNQSAIFLVWSLVGCVGCDSKPGWVDQSNRTQATVINRVEAVQGATLSSDAYREKKEIRKVKCHWLQLHAQAADRIVRIYNGDTFSMDRFEGETPTFPFEGEPPTFKTINDFDAPELDQPFGKEAADRLAALFSSENVSAGPATKKAADLAALSRRAVGENSPPKTDIGRPGWPLVLNRGVPILVAELMAEEGLGWWTGPEMSSGHMAMRRAIKAKRGLWSGSSPIAPWVWRELTEEQRVYLR